MLATITTLSDNAFCTEEFCHKKNIVVRRKWSSPEQKTGISEGKEENTIFPGEIHKINWFKRRIAVLEKSLALKTPLIWKSVIGMFIFHVVAAICILNIFAMQWRTFVWGVAVGGTSAFGVTAGAHRLWCHRAYSAKLPLRIILAICYVMAGQIPLYDWVRDHRVHHKYSETDADPHNAKRGFFFAHVGWLMMKKHPEVLKLGKNIDMSDILADPVVRFHDKYFTPLKMIFCFIIPSLVPALAWGESWQGAILQTIIRYSLGLNFTWLVNSAAHIYGRKPYDARISPTENNLVAFLSMGEGWHNYHHRFPWDYKAAELGDYALNGTTFWIDFFAKIGWAYDLKQPSKNLVKAIADKHGDGSHPLYGHDQ